MPKIRHKYVKNFTTVSNQLVRDSHLSYKARGIFLYLWHLPDDWEISLADIRAHSHEDGQRSVRTGITELEERGYVALQRVRAPVGGKFTDTAWLLDDEPDTQKPSLEKPSLHFAKMDNAKLDNAKMQNGNTPKDYPDPSTINLKTEESSPPISPAGGKRPRVRKPRVLNTEYSEGFLGFWQVYPGERAVAKPECWQLWRDRQLEPRAGEFILKIERLKETSWQGKEPTFIPLAHTWLNQGRYEDTLVPLSAIPTQPQSGRGKAGYESTISATNLIQRRHADERHDGELRRLPARANETE